MYKHQTFFKQASNVTKYSRMELVKFVEDSH